MSSRYRQTEKKESSARDNHRHHGDITKEKERANSRNSSMRTSHRVIDARNSERKRSERSSSTSNMRDKDKTDLNHNCRMSRISESNDKKRGDTSSVRKREAEYTDPASNIKRAREIFLADKKDELDKPTNGIGSSATTLLDNLENSRKSSQNNDLKSEKEKLSIVIVNELSSESIKKKNENIQDGHKKPRSPIRYGLSSSESGTTKEFRQNSIQNVLKGSSRNSGFSIPSNSFQNAHQSGGFFQKQYGGQDGRSTNEFISFGQPKPAPGGAVGYAPISGFTIRSFGKSKEERRPIMKSLVNPSSVPKNQTYFLHDDRERDDPTDQKLLKQEYSKGYQHERGRERDSGHRQVRRESERGRDRERERRHRSRSPHPPHHRSSASHHTSYTHSTVNKDNDLYGYGYTNSSVSRATRDSRNHNRDSRQDSAPLGWRTQPRENKTSTTSGRNNNIAPKQLISTSAADSVSVWSHDKFFEMEEAQQNVNTSNTDEVIENVAEALNSYGRPLTKDTQ